MMSQFTDKPHVGAILIAAMGQEIRPFCDRATNLGEVQQAGNAHMQQGQIGGVDVVLVRSGIGLVNGASATVAALHRWSADIVISVGSAGGLPGKVNRGDVIASTELTYSTADAVAFGYVLGQVPGMPPHFTGDPATLAALGTDTDIVQGAIASGDVFVSGYLLDSVLFEFPETAAVDMESTAVAQVCHSYEVPFISIRGISDLCGEDASAEHDQNLDDVAERSADIVVKLLSRMVARA